MDTSLPDDRLDAAIDEVARAMTDAPHGRIAADFAARVALRRRMSRRILVPALAAAVVLLAVATVVELRAPAPSPAPTTVNVVAVPREDVPLPREADAHADTVTPASPIARRVVHHVSRRVPLDAPFQSDLSPAPLRVGVVTVTGIAVDPEPAPPSIAIAPIEVEPIEPRGGSR